MSFYTIYIFDVDGTLTPSRELIDPEFEEFFLDWATLRNVYLITGSDHPKTLEQVGRPITEVVAAVYNCAGNSIWKKGKETYHSDWVIPQTVKRWLRKRLKESPFPLRTGQHIEERTGLVNFSIVGRGAVRSEKKLYIKYDEHSGERHQIAADFNEAFPSLEASVGGETGVDLYPRGRNKSQILAHLGEVGEIFFFGDAIHKKGNDWPLAEAIRNRNNAQDHVYAVRDWRETFQILQSL